MSVEISSDKIYGNVQKEDENISSDLIYENYQKSKKADGVHISSDLIYENYQKPKKEEKVNSDLPPTEAATNVLIHEKPAESSRCHLLFGLGILCLLLVASISIISWISVGLVKRDEELTEQMAKVRGLENQTEQLTEERDHFENQTKQLSLEKFRLEKEVEQLNVKVMLLENENEEAKRQNDELNRMKDAILAAENFPVKDFCPDKKCQPCQKDWIQFQGKCYLFYESYCETWTKAQEFCLNKAADLVFVDNQQEQDFLKKHIKVYSSCWSAQVCYYYLLLPNQSYGYWTERGLMTFQGSLIHNHNPAGYSSRNRFICEGDVMMWPK